MVAHLSLCGGLKCSDLWSQMLGSVLGILGHRMAGSGLGTPTDRPTYQATVAGTGPYTEHLGARTLVS